MTAVSIQQFDQASSHRSRAPYVAAIDIGSNSIKFLLSHLDENRNIHVVHDLAFITRLGKNVDRTGFLNSEAIDRSVAVLKRIAEISENVGATLVVVGTSALRDVRNPQDFIEPSEQILHSDIEIISGKREAELAFLGAVHGINVHDTDVLSRSFSVDEGSRTHLNPEQSGRYLTVIDIGGGSTEIAFGRDSTLHNTVSLDLGAVRLMERCGLSFPLDKQQLTKTLIEINRIIRLSEINIKGSIIGIGGTATTIGAIVRKVEPFSPDHVHNQHISLVTIDKLCNKLARMSLSELADVKGLEIGRADIIVPGAMILGELLRYAGATHLVISVGGIRFGLTLEAYQKIAID